MVDDQFAPLTQKIQTAIEAEDFQGTDDYGVPILNFDSVVAGQVEVEAVGRDVSS